MPSNRLLHLTPWASEAGGVAFKEGNDNDVHVLRRYKTGVHESVHSPARHDAAAASPQPSRGIRHSGVVWYLLRLHREEWEVDVQGVNDLHWVHERSMQVGALPLGNPNRKRKIAPPRDISLQVQLGLKCFSRPITINKRELPDIDQRAGGGEKRRRAVPFSPWLIAYVPHSRMSREIVIDMY